jgi:ATP-dependent DNA helicase RecG
MDIYTTDDLISYYPYRYNVIKIVHLVDAPDGETVTIKGIVDTEPRVSYINKKLNRMTFKVLTDNYLINVTIFNRAFYKMHLKVGRMINIIGKYERKNNTFTASDIKFEIINGSKVEPVYHLVNGLKSKNLNKIIMECFKYDLNVVDYIPDYIVDKYNFINKLDSLKEIHNPINNDLYKKARLRLIYEEFFQFMFKISYLKYKYSLNNAGLSRDVDYSKVEEFIKTLPFELTVDQQKSVEDIYNDLIEPRRMNRLVLGDVGSGKTVVAEIAMYINYLSGYQSAMMAPTEILARQHYDGVSKMFSNTDIKVGLLVGSMKKSEKDKTVKKLIDGEIDILIGTHAVISENVEFNNLGLVITDEQHRFGVNQRSNLQNKGVMCDVLYLSATPIPRTYALTLYGDMDTSIIKTKPSGRKEIITKVYKMDDLKDVLYKMLEEIKEGHQIYVVAPLIEESDKIDLENVYEIEANMNKAFGKKYNIGVLHGKLSETEKDEIMDKFKNNDIQILISTTVVEVGVDVPNATMMVIYDAFRFGLSALHQLRGRVGRNSLQSYCILLSNRETERLDILTKTTDGFKVAEEDFKLRGSGDLFGSRQSGDMQFNLADLKKDFDILMKAKEDSEKLLEMDDDRYSYIKNIIINSNNLD